MLSELNSHIFRATFYFKVHSCVKKNMTTWVRKYSVFYMKLFKSTIVTQYSNMSQKDIQETISQLPEGSSFPVVASETPYLQKVVESG